MVFYSAKAKNVFTLCSTGFSLNNSTPITSSLKSTYPYELAPKTVNSFSINPKSPPNPINYIRSLNLSFYTI